MNIDSGIDGDTAKSDHSGNIGKIEMSADSSHNTITDIHSSVTTDRETNSVSQKCHTLELTWDYTSVQHAQVVRLAVEQEVGEIDDARSCAQVENNGTTVTVNIAAADLIALRAGANTWTRFVAVAEQLFNSADDLKLE
ncbi:KEOPS complex subunit Pcc1 [Haloquadratum walsbyi]|uniref:KEOPS complex subunit Pcc1 n=1 Tax=Haloquadratum walsbyi (strain DSM 16854 / JCM 12705 / C23) TaxID=768065 RepID=G0LHP0_HALWC|nr:KEOPS complex subunit Pcc1 [Haloquadratum walsbyi]CCC39278.1 KEOPS complex subunit Pcc1 [Haloquadratum walsbyi C23]